ncbi:MAG: hypothetical protein RI601_08120, partial [Desulfurivibrionaceae bacterium]|nr:hypothetical protein [Desulfurivibrionaceae bacterium]
EPEVMADPEILNQWCSKLTAGQEKVDALYRRWEELGAKEAALDARL